MPDSYLESVFDLWLRQEGHHDFKREWVFAHPRKWRFDFAWPAHLFAVEIEGGLFKGGRHQTIKGFMDDAEKHEAALRLGWTVYRVPGPWVAEGQRPVWRPEVMDTIREILQQRQESV